MEKGGEWEDTYSYFSPYMQSPCPFLRVSMNAIV